MEMTRRSSCTTSFQAFGSCKPTCCHGTWPCSLLALIFLIDSHIQLLYTIDGVAQNPVEELQCYRVPCLPYQHRGFALHYQYNVPPRPLNPKMPQAIKCHKKLVALPYMWQQPRLHAA